MLDLQKKNLCIYYRFKSSVVVHNVCLFMLTWNFEETSGNQGDLDRVEVRQGIWHVNLVLRN